jgi:hypothetical protein
MLCSQGLGNSLQRLDSCPLSKQWLNHGSKKHGRPDIAFNNAGIDGTMRTPLEGLSSTQFGITG